jgi:hypothetical protein
VKTSRMIKAHPKATQVMPVNRANQTHDLPAAMTPFGNYHYQAGVPHLRHVNSAQAPLQMVKTKSDGEQSLSSARAQENMQMVQSALPQLPPQARALLAYIQSHFPEYLPTLFNLDNRLIRNVLLGLHMTPASEFVIPSSIGGFQRLFMQLASTQMIHSPSAGLRLASAEPEQLALPAPSDPQQPVFNQRGQAQIMFSMLGLIGGERPEQPIEQQIHRFWTGGPLSGAAMDNLLESAQKTQNSAWQNNLWYSSNIEKGMAKALPPHKLELREAQRYTLAQNGYRIRDIESLARNPGFFSTKNPNSPIALIDLNRASTKAFSDLAQSMGYDSIKYFSDLARLLYLHEEGGIHMDVDIGLGDMDLNKAYYQNDPAGRVPLMGSILRSSDDKEVIALLKVLEQFNQSGFYKDSESARYFSVIEQIAQRAVNGAGMYNALIGTRRGNPHIALALIKFMNAFELRNDLPTGMQFNRYLLLGRKETTQKNYQNAAAMSVPPYLLALRHLTSESDA